MSTIRKKMVQDLELAGYALKNGRRISNVSVFSRSSAGHRRRLTKEHVRAWVARLQKNKIGPQRLRQHFAALKFLFGKTLGRPQDVAFLSWPKDPKRLPEILTAEQASTLLGALESPKYRVFSQRCTRRACG